MITGVEFPQANIFRIIPLTDGLSTLNIDYVNRMPQFSLMRLNTQYQIGIYPTDKGYYPDFKINEQIKIQIWNDDPVNAKIYKKGSTSGTIMTKTNITPVGWVDYDVYQFSYTPTSSGFYYIKIEFEVPDPETPGGSVTAVAITDTFYVTDNLTNDKNLIELQFYSDDNTNLVFQTDTYYKTYYSGTMLIGDSEINVSEFNEDTPEKLASLTYDKITVILNEIDQLYYPVILRQIECESLKVNGIPCVFANSISREPSSEKTGLIDITIEFRVQYDNSVIYFT